MVRDNDCVLVALRLHRWGLEGVSNIPGISRWADVCKSGFALFVMGKRQTRSEHSQHSRQDRPAWLSSGAYVRGDNERATYDANGIWARAACAYPGNHECTVDCKTY